jgi:hypothetical protein
MTILFSLVLGGLTAVWRFFDGSDQRWANSNLYAVALVLTAGLVALQPLSYPTTLALVWQQEWPLLLPVGVTAWLLTRGMPGFEYWLPNRDQSGQGRSGMLLGFALPALLAASLYSLLAGLSLWTVPFALSGAIVTSTYVGLSRLELRLGSLPGPFTAEEWGRISYGFMVLGIGLLGK